MAKNNKKVLILFLAFGAVSANATDVWWQTSNPLSDALNTSSTSYQIASTGTTQSWWNAASTTASSVASGGGSSWYSASNWATAAVSATPVVADDLYRSYLYTGNSGATAAASTTTSWWNSYGGNSDTSAQASGSSWNSWNSSSSGTGSSAVSGVSTSWWNSGGGWNNPSYSSGQSSGGSWWNGGNGSVNSDSTACNLVSSWAASTDWRTQWASPTAAASSSSTATCNQSQSSTINNLAATTNLVPTNAPIGGNGEVTIDDFDVPEPQTWMMMVGGLAMIEVARRRKRNAA